MWSGYGSHMGWMSLWWFGGVAALLLVVWLIAHVGGTSSHATVGESPETILKRRYARGDITRDEFEKRLSDLRRS